jgi:uncharacterized protein YndB with AHSA1/START domain
MNWTQQRKQKARRRRALTVLAIVATALAGSFLAGILLPVEHVGVGHALLDRSPETVWRVLTDLDGMPLWRSDLTAVERLPNVAGRPAWREIGRGGTRVVELTLADPPRRLVTQRAAGGRSALPIRTFDLDSAATGTRVTITERGEVRNPLARILVRLRSGAPAIDRFLHDLDQRLSAGRRQVAAEGAH